MGDDIHRSASRASLRSAHSSSSGQLLATPARYHRSGRALMISGGASLSLESQRSLGLLQVKLLQSHVGSPW
jgi:hypothetical protein